MDELTIGGLAEVQAAREAASGDPLDSVRDLIDAAYVAPEDRVRIADAYDRAESGIDEDDEPAAGATREAFALLRVALRSHHPSVGDDDVGEILYAMTVEEHQALQRAVMRSEPLSVLIRTIDRLAGTTPTQEGGSDDADWHAWVDRVARGLGVSYDEVRRMTLTQFWVAIVEGKSPDGRSVRSIAEAETTSRAWKAWFAEGGSINGG